MTAQKSKLHLAAGDRPVFGDMLRTVCGRWIKGVAQSKPRAIVWDCVGDPKLATCDECRRAVTA
jgi:hypothetical protein